ncbi:hypothetical protein BROUX41_001876 [Berkeleyomyces rouxiae]|uniref:uncharacterized protein n=1 Tax=Berkeleyomyces rouxiae TaxID=2035830 RepID=UPI003B79604D
MPRYQPSRELHVVVFGAGGVGKSCLTAQFVHNEWIESYDPTIEDTYRTQIHVDLSTGTTNSLGDVRRASPMTVHECHFPLTYRLPVSVPCSLDTAGTEQFVAMRDLYMKTGQGFLLVFSITSNSSLTELASLRKEIIRIKDDETVPIVIVGNKSDLEDQREVSRARAFAISQEWGSPYYEASARTRTNVDEVFIDLCRQMLRRDDIYEVDQTEERHNARRRRRSGKKGRGSGLQRCVIL